MPASRSMLSNLLTLAMRRSTVVGGGTEPSTITRPAATVAPQISTASWQNRSSARSMPRGSAPRSNRVDASDRRPSLRLVFAIVIRSQTAASSRTLVVVSLISVAAPPITPARLIGSSAPLQTTPSAAVNDRSTSSRVVRTSPSDAIRTRIAPSGTVARSKV